MLRTPPPIPDPLQVLDTENFALGLNLRDAVSSVADGYAIDLCNVIFNEVGAVRARAGTVLLQNVTEDHGLVEKIVRFESGGSAWFVMLTDAKIRTYLDNYSDWTPTSSTTLPAGGYQWSAVRLGTPATSKLYVSRGTGVVVSEGSSQSTDANWGKPRLLGISPDGRLMGLGYPASGTGTQPVATTGLAFPAGDDSMVVFGDLANPASRDGGNFIRLRPGDGELFTGCVSFGDRTFVFKESAMFVIGNPGLGAGGAPLYPRQMVELPEAPLGPRAITVGLDGIYFATRNGIYFTNGGVPQRFSQLIDPVFTARALPYFSGGVIDWDRRDELELFYVENKLVLSYPTAGESLVERQLVFDFLTGGWTHWRLPIGAMFEYDEGLGFIEDGEGRLTGLGSDLIGLWLMRESTVPDFQAHVYGYSPFPTPLVKAPEPFECWWRSGFQDYGSSNIKQLHEVKVLGQHPTDFALDLRVSRDFGTLAETTTAMTVLGIAESGRELDWENVRVGLRGTQFSLELRGWAGTDDYTLVGSTLSWINLVSDRWAVHVLSQRIAMSTGLASTRRDRT